MNFDDASKALVELAASRHNALHTSEAASIGFDARRLRRARARGEIYNVAPRVWAMSALPSSPEQRLRAATLSLPGAAAVMGSSAWLFGWILHPPPVPQEFVPVRARPLDNVMIHRNRNIDPEHDLVEVDHIRCLKPPITLCLLGNVASEAVVERALDEYLRAPSDHDLDAAIERLCHGRVRVPRGIRVLEAVRSNPKRVAGVSESWLERVTARLVSFDWMPPLVLQHPLVAEGKKFRLDIACPALKLGIEAHSRTFHWGPEKADADNVRDLLLSTIGWKLLYVTYSQTLDPEGFATLFAKAARQRANQLQVHLPAA